jgi:UPF0755 protein
MKKKRKQKLLKRKFKYIFVLIGILSVGMFGIVFFFNFDPSLLAKLSFYIDLANPSVKLVQVQEGLRKEEVAEVVGERLGWSEEEKEDFLKIHMVLNSIYMEGHYFPKTYLINKDETPTNVSEEMINESIKQVDKIEQSKNSLKLDGDTAVVIASIIQREAAGKSDMRLISGIIWNRMAEEMKLQVDATLQYAKGSEEDGWWGRVRPEDKNIESEYNTYMYKGLPPGAISNPGPDALYAAYHPQKTKCMFYLHDRRRKIHCTETYTQHKRNIDLYY